MRLYVISDVHLEFGPFSLPDDIGDFDVAVFAGDIGRPVTDAIAWIDLQRKGPLKGRPVVYVPGNHEYYRSELGAALRAGQRLAQEAGIHLLAPGAVVVGDARFIGCTLWTDYGLLGDAKRARQAALLGMNDHRLIEVVEGGYRMSFQPRHAAALHQQELDFITESLAKPFDGATIVVTHHAPHPGSVQPRYRGDALSPAFASDLTEIIERYEPDLWIHGHDHGSHDYRVGRTRILSNQAGYPRGGGRENPRFDPHLIVDVSPPGNSR
jgi:Icc-related predicted phosphoesterase